MKKRTSAATGYSKISATLEAPVLRQIRERTANVSGFLNEAAKRELYFGMLRTTDDELGRMGVGVDELFYRNLKKWIHGVDERKRRRTARANRPSRAG